VITANRNILMIVPLKGIPFLNSEKILKSNPSYEMEAKTQI